MPVTGKQRRTPGTCDTAGTGRDRIAGRGRRDRRPHAGYEGFLNRELRTLGPVVGERGGLRGKDSSPVPSSPPLAAT